MDTLENAHRRGSRSLELAGKTAVVTGAASGIGRAIAIELATAGADVLVHTRGRRELLAEVCDLVRQLGCKSQFLLADFADQSAVESFADRSWQWQSGIDIWVNNAGADVLTPPHGDLSFADKLALLWKVDVQGTILLSRAIGRRMRDHGRGGVIVNLGWDQAETGMAGDSGELFAATKAAVMAFSRSLAKSLAPAVRVNCVAPGWIKTAWGAQAPTAWDERARCESLLRRWGAPEDVARTVRFLASPDAAFINGQVLAVNGGLNAWPAT